jgi:hypothetical protein
MFFGFSLASWENAMVSCLIIAGIFAFLAGLATWAVVRLQRVEIAEANARQSEAELKLGQLRALAGPRDIKFEEFKKALEGKPKAPVSIWYLPDSSDGYWFASRLQVALGISGWSVDAWPRPIPEPDQNNVLVRDMPRAVAAGGQAMGVTVVGDQGTPGDDSDMRGNTAFKALFDALTKGTNLTGVYGASGSQFTPVPKGTLRVVVAAKPDPMFIDKPSATAK